MVKERLNVIAKLNDIFSHLGVDSLMRMVIINTVEGKKRI
ncbi:MAG: hypothetical protein ACK5NC_02265 [Vibrio sp.]